eukprot:4024382-Karenia_brevis.AAC.1
MMSSPMMSSPPSPQNLPSINLVISYHTPVTGAQKHAPGGPEVGLRDCSPPCHLRMKMPKASPAAARWRFSGYTTPQSAGPLKYFGPKHPPPPPLDLVASPCGAP